jgi:hypothetical protein
MKKVKYCVVAISLSFCLSAISWADNGIAVGDELKFTDLPGAVQRTVIAQTRIPAPADVVRVIQDANDIYAITVRTGSGEKTVYVSDWGKPVQCPAVGR